MTALTNTAIDALLAGAELKDDRVPGLSARRHKSGVSFMLYYRTRTGIARRPKIGDYGTLTIAVARDIARDMLAKVAAGQDPVAERNTARGEPTMDDLWAKCAAEHWNGGKDWDREAKRLYETRLKPKLGKDRVRSISYDGLNKIHDSLSATPVEANHVIAVASKMLSLAEKFGPEGAKWRDLNSNPCALIERYVIPKRRRFATPAEIAKLGAVLDRYAEHPHHVTGVAFLYILMFSGARPSEIERALPKQLERVVRDGAAYGVLRVDGKTGQRNVFLPPQAMRVIDKLPVGRARLADRKTMPKRLWELVRTEIDAPDLWARDLRRTFGTVALSSGTATLDQLSELLGHASRQTTMIYAKLMEDPAHAAAAGTAGRMEQLLGGSKVGAENR